MDSMLQMDQIMSSLRKKGFRITPQRIAIVDHLLKTEEHPSAESIHNTIRKKHPTISLSTVYKTLDMLKKGKMVNEIDIGGEARFDAHTDEHINMVCMKCGKIEDVNDSLINEIRSKAARRTKYLVLKVSFELQGHCSKCRLKDSR